MKQLSYTVRFNTPAFLGNAEQSGQWRTPPFKALLRQWWRMAYAAEKRFNVDLDVMRREEGMLFGNAWLSHQEGNREVADHRKSEVRIRLDKWALGKLRNWEGTDQTVRHPEVKNRQPVGSHLYLGYGPLVFRNGTALKSNAAIQTGESATLSIAVRDEHAPRLERSLWLMDRYGALGGRSRNGWGSCSLLPTAEGWGEGAALAGQIPLRPWRDCLTLDWPHAIGKDDRPLIWQTQPFDDWKTLMKRLAEIKIGLRTQFAFTTGKNAPRTEDRHWLSYPVTNHSVAAWVNNARLPNTLRFKARPVAGGRLVGVIFHVPHLPPASFRPDSQNIERVWKKVHEYLDDSERNLTRVPE